jgi:hypothetical protein
VDTHASPAAMQYGRVGIESIREIRLLRFLYLPLGSSIDPLYFPDHCTDHLMYCFILLCIYILLVKTQENKILIINLLMVYC